MNWRASSIGLAKPSSRNSLKPFALNINIYRETKEENLEQVLHAVRSAKALT
jgi:hypothetical protein